MSCIRFTPALVGKTYPINLHLSSIKVHPHACGENGKPARIICGKPGSPPRLWGKQHDNAADGSAQRFTPTLVGKTNPRHLKRLRQRVHPHACGENTTNTFRNGAMIGSPPRLWGKHDILLVDSSDDRFTPTLVGKTRPCLWPQHQRAVHPHACGENDGARLAYSNRHGSPPRLWGKRTGCQTRDGHLRFTPTLVGKTF